MDNNEYLRQLEREVQRHWAPHVISLGYLIQDAWSDPDSGANKQDYNYLVFVDTENDLDWIVNDDFSERKIPRETYSLISRIASLSSLANKALKEEDIITFRVMLGNAIVSALEGDYETAERISNQAVKQHQDCVYAKSRLWTLVSSIVCLAVVSTLYFGLALGCPPIERCYFGVLGAFSSIICGVGSRVCDIKSGLCLHALEVCSRFVVGMIMGAVSYEFVNSSLAPDILKDFCDTLYGARTISFVAGLFIRFIPNMLSKYVIAEKWEEGK